MAELTFDTERGKLSLTCSFGVSEWEQGENIDQLLKRADAALYEAKAGGRNRVIAARGIRHPGRCPGLPVRRGDAGEPARRRAARPRREIAAGGDRVVAAPIAVAGTDRIADRCATSR